jgi:hypothetical protein
MRPGRRNRAELAPSATKRTRSSLNSRWRRPRSTATGKVAEADLGPIPNLATPDALKWHSLSRKRQRLLDRLGLALRFSIRRLRVPDLHRDLRFAGISADRARFG